MSQVHRCAPSVPAAPSARPRGPPARAARGSAARQPASCSCSGTPSACPAHAPAASSAAGTPSGTKK